MKLRFHFLKVFLAGVAAFPFAVVRDSFAQAAKPDSPQSGIVLANLSAPIYPPLARQTQITGEVNLSLGIRPDGSVESVAVISGHPLLRQAALESAQQSQFECRGCREPLTSYSLVYRFQLTGGDCCTQAKGSSDLAQPNEKPPVQIIQSRNQITVIDRATCFCDPGVLAWKVRSAKCLYLWTCGWRM
jgi:TonB family protein